jgi:hypothetical protein
MNTFAAFNDSDDEAPARATAPKTVTKASGAPKAKAAPKAGAAATGDEAVNPRSRGAQGGKMKNKERGQGRAVKPKDGEPRQRQFDRKSGTGRGKEVSKGGHGGWGNEGNEARDAQKHGAIDEAAQGRADAANEKEDGEEADAAPVVPAKPTFTFDEFMAKKNATKANSELFGATNERKASSVDGIQQVNSDIGVFMKLGQDKSQRQKGQQRVKVTAGPGFMLAKPAMTDRPDDIKSDRPDRGERPPRVDRGDRPERTERSGGARGAGRGDRDRAPGGGRGGRGDRRDGGAPGARAPAARAPSKPTGLVNFADADAFPAL